MNSVIDSFNFEKEKNLSTTSKELTKMEEFYKSILYKKDKNIEHLMKYKNLINEEFIVIKQILNMNYNMNLNMNLKPQNLK